VLDYIARCSADFISSDYLKLSGEQAVSWRHAPTLRPATAPTSVMTEAMRLAPPLTNPQSSNLEISTKARDLLRMRHADGPKRPATCCECKPLHTRAEHARD